MFRREKKTSFASSVDFLFYKVSKDIFIFVCGSAALCWTLAAFSSFFILYIVGRTPWMGDQSVARPLPAHRTAQTE
jgi:hypothetical protein